MNALAVIDVYEEVYEQDYFDESANDRIEANLHKHINQSADNKKQEAQDKAKTDKRLERRAILFRAKKRRTAIRTVLCPIFIGATLYASTIGHISGDLATYIIGAALVYFGWSMNDMTRMLLNRKGGRYKKSKK